MAHVFISYVRENSEEIQRLYDELTQHGVEVWLDRNDIPGGARWKPAIRRAIQDGAFFIACFSREYNERDENYMNEELILAIDRLRKISTDQAWFIPVKLSECEIPGRDIGGGETLKDFQYIELYNDWDGGIQKILKSVGKTIILSNQYSNPWALEQDIKTSQKRAEEALSDTINFINKLPQKFLKSNAMKKAKKFLTDFRFRFDGQFTVIDSNRNIVFHDIKGAIGRPYSKFLPDFDRIFKEYVIGKNSGIINWIDFLSSDYVLIDKVRRTGSQNVNWIRFNTSPFLYFEPWDWYIIVEAHHEIHELKPSEITNFIDYFRNHGWLVVETLYILTSGVNMYEPIF